MINSPHKKTTSYLHAVGRRKTAVARVRLYSKSAKTTTPPAAITINNRPGETYFASPTAQSALWEPFRTTNTLDKYTATVKVAGGGQVAQLDAVIHGLSRALTKADPAAYKKILRDKGFLTRDPRMRERRKIGTGGKARRQKQSPKR